MCVYSQAAHSNSVSLSLLTLNTGASEILQIWCILIYIFIASEVGVWKNVLLVQACFLLGAGRSGMGGGPRVLGDGVPPCSDAGTWETILLQLGPVLVLGPCSGLSVTPRPSLFRLRLFLFIYQEGTRASRTVCPQGWELRVNGAVVWNLQAWGTWVWGPPASGPGDPSLSGGAWPWTPLGDAQHAAFKELFPCSLV